MPILIIIQFLFALIRYLPQIIQIIHAIVELIKELRGTPGFNERASLRDLAQAMRYAKRTKDTSQLEALHAKLAVALNPNNPPVVHTVADATAESVANELKDLGRELGEKESHPFAGFRKE